MKFFFLKQHIENDKKESISSSDENEEFLIRQVINEDKIKKKKKLRKTKKILKLKKNLKKINKSQISSILKNKINPNKDLEFAQLMQKNIKINQKKEKKLQDEAKQKQRQKKLNGRYIRLANYLYKSKQKSSDCTSKQSKNVNKNLSF